MSGYGKVIGPGTIRFDRLLPSPIERVWEYLTHSDKRQLWLASGTMEPRVGAQVALSYDNAGLSPDKTPPPEKYKGRGRATTRHTITRFEPPRFLTLTWGDDKNPSEVSFELTAEGNRVRLVLTHRRLPGRSSMLNVGPGWHVHLAILSDCLNGRAPGAFWTLFSNVEDYYQKNVPADAATPEGGEKR
jgi:uncharacterized protein YndB with AHSA1/START domain